MWNMKKLLGLAAGLTLAAVAAPSLAQAQNAYTTDYVNLRAGPGLEYPVVFEVAQGQPLESYGCLDGYSWCDVSVNGYRGWIAGEFIQYAYNGGYEPLYVYGPRYHVPIISFSFVSYWDTHYRNYRWYSYRDNWSHYDWRSRRWDDDRWRQWANNNRHDWDRWDGRRDGRDGRDGRRADDWRYQDDWRRQAHNNGVGGNGRNDGDRDGRNGGWNGRSDNGRDNNGRDGSRFGNNDGNRNGSWNRGDNDRRPGSPVRDPATGGVHANDPSVHSGNTDNRNDGTRFGNPQRWGNSSYKPDSVNYGGRNQRFDNNGGNNNGANNGGNNDRGKRFDNQSNTRIDRNVVTPKVDAPKNITPRVDRSNDAPKVDRSNRNDGGNNGNDRKVDRSNRNDGKNNKRDRDDGRS